MNIVTHSLHDPVDFLAEVDELSDLVLPEEAVVVLRQLVDQLLPLLHQHVDAEQRGHLRRARSFIYVSVVYPVCSIR